MGKFRLATFSMAQPRISEQHLLPENCQNEHSSSILGADQLAELAQSGLVILDLAMKPKEVLAVRTEAEVLDIAGELKAVPTFAGYDVRGDRAKWIDGEGDAALAGAVRLLRGFASPLDLQGCF